MVRWAVAVVMAACAVVLVLEQTAVRPLEASLAARITGIVHVAPASAIKTVVLFPTSGRLAGLAINASCSIALLVSPFCLLAGGLVLSRRTSPPRGLATLGVAVLWLLAVNQTRIVIIVLSIRLWGIERGYELSHVVFGTFVSTIGVLGGLFIFVRSMATAPAHLELRR